MLILYCSYYYHYYYYYYYYYYYCYYYYYYYKKIIIIIVMQKYRTQYNDSTTGMIVAMPMNNVHKGITEIIKIIKRNKKLRFHNPIIIIIIIIIII